MQKIIANPDILIGFDSSFKTGSLHGEEWKNPDVVKAILDMIHELPYFRELLIAFFTGAAETWARFISEFAPGGLIDEATMEEKDLAWMPATNDVNEGALGQFCVMIRRQPQLTLLGHNAIAMYFRNDTEAFMKEKFTEKEDHQFLHKLARESTGEEKKRKKEIVDFREERQMTKVGKRNKRKQKKAETDERLKNTKLILTKPEVTALKGKPLTDQWVIYKALELPNLAQLKAAIVVDEKRQAMRDAIDFYEKGEWKIDGDTDSGEEFIGLDDGDSDWPSSENELEFD